jgi:ABC-type lipoprotein export system ATPase subunit
MTLTPGPPASTAYVLCEDVFKIHKTDELEVVALRGLDLAVAPGEVMAIVGASGSGKSTLLNILAGLDQPSAGRVRVGNRDLLTMNDEELTEYRRSEVGFVWQQTGRNLIPYLTARQNVEVPQLVDGSDRGEASNRALELLESVGLADKAGHKPNQLSGGEQQRVAIAVALANNPPLLLADEPTGELDSATATQVFEVLHELNESTGVTIIIVSHDRAITQRVDRVVTMRDGRTSAELVRPRSYRRERLDMQEFTLVDRSGRMQIPREYVERLGIGSRARLELHDDHVEVRAGDADGPLT